MTTAMLVDIPRFWIPRGVECPEWRGYLHIISPSYAQLPGKARPVQLSELEDVPLLILLGEAGMGKSVALRRECERISMAAPSNDSGKLLYCDLRFATTEQAFIKRVFQSDVFDRCQQDGDNLTIFLDSFDEACISIKELALILEREITDRRLDPARIHLRIACRSGALPATLERFLHDYWAPALAERHKRRTVWQLCPMRHDDVHAWASSEGIVSDNFIRAVSERKVEHLANRPATLRFLLSLYKRKQDRLPPTRVEIYKDGCKVLCEESIERKGAGRTVTLSPDQLMRAAGKAAYLMIFGNKVSIYVGPRSECPDPAILEDDLLGSENAEPRFLIDKQATEALFRTSGLFQTSDTSTIVFAHKSYAEFLAAWYIVQCNLSVQQVKQLLTHQSDGQLVPQLQETAGWLSSFDGKASEWVSSQAPSVILRSDVPMMEPLKRPALLETLLNEAGRTGDIDWPMTEYIPRLVHDGIEEQLRPHLLDSKGPTVARVLALHIAGLSGASHLWADDLANIALSPDEPYDIRAYAAAAVARSTDPGDVLRLKPLLSYGKEVDPDDKLRGVALQALWRQLTADELFSFITRRHKPNNFADYSNALREIGDDMPDGYLLHALEWVAKQDPDLRLDTSVAKLEAVILKRAWKKLEDDVIGDALAEVIVTRLRRHTSLFGQQQEGINYRDEIEARHHFLSRLMAKLNDADDDALGPQILLPADSNWLLDRYDAEADPVRKKRWAKWAESAFYPFSKSPDDVRFYDRLFEHCWLGRQPPDEPIRTQFQDWVVCWFEDPKVTTRRARWKQERALEAEDAQAAAKAETEPTRDELLAEGLALHQSGKIAWPKFVEALQIDAQGQDHFHAVDLIDVPSDDGKPDGLRKTLHAAAMQHLERATCEIDPFLLGESDIQYVNDFRAVTAFDFLLGDDTPPSSAELWSKWAGPILYEGVHIAADRATRLLRPAALHARPALLDAVQKLVRRDLKKLHGGPSWLEHCRVFWGTDTAAVLRNELLLSKHAPQARKPLYRILLSQGDEQTIQWCTQQALDKASPSRIEAAASLVSYCWAHAPDRVLHELEADHDFAKAVLIESAWDYRDSQAASLYSAKDSLVRLYKLTEILFPTTEGALIDNQDQTSHRIADLKRFFVRAITSHSADDAVAALAELSAAFPLLSEIRRIAAEVRRQARFQSWIPVEVEALKKMAVNAQTRAIRSSDELQKMVLDQLNEFAATLRQDASITHRLWAGDSPKDELVLTNEVKHELTHAMQRIAATANREVEVNNWPGKGRGESTDLLIEKAVEGQRSLSVVLEAKRSHNTGVLTDMRAQLADRYLVGTGRRHGIYLVGWYGDAYNPPGHDKATMTSELKRQAAALLSEGLFVEVVVLDASLSSSPRRKKPQSAKGSQTTSRKAEQQ